MEDKPKRIGGRGKGTRNRTTVQTKAIIQKIVNDEIDNFPTLLDSLKPVDRANVVCKLIAYLIPKKQSIDLELPADRFTPLNITIIQPPKLLDHAEIKD
ncbi:hypothetical protein [Flavobacterium sp. WC2429]|uniref:DUF5681 domain-containing protein n=1 Tax=Flavobacterium sp. WC2429 TaxID=3234140 RepID=A0AB39WM52_9FLAO